MLGRGDGGRPGRGGVARRGHSVARRALGAAHVVVITEPAARVASAELEGRRRETLCLTWEERRWTRRRVVTSSGREVGLALPTGSVLQPGDIVAVETDWYLQIDRKSTRLNSSHLGI